MIGSGENVPAPRGKESSEGKAMGEGTRDFRGVEAPAPGRWSIDASRSRLTFVARYLEVARLRARFRRLSGIVVVDARPEASHLEVGIDAASIDTGIPMLDRVLRSRRFLDVERYPRFVFRSTGVSVRGRTGLEVVGDLSIRGVTREVSMEVVYRGVEPWGGPVARFFATAEVDRMAFGLGWRHILGVPLSGRTVRAEMDVLLVRP